MYITQLKLFNYRNHKQLNINLDAKFSFIIGENGIGKTNILESIGLFAPGKSFRNANLTDFFHNNNSNEWAVKASYKHNHEELDFSTGSKIEQNKFSKRIMKANDEELSKHAQILKYLKVIWMIPQADGLFTSSPSTRRKFIDRMTYNFFPEHALDILIYEKLVKDRMRVIENYGYEKKWVDVIEKQLAQFSIKIAQNRNYVLNLISEKLQNSNFIFLKPNISLSCKVINFLQSDNPEAVIKEKFQEYRLIDAKSGRTNFGIHKTDLISTHPYKKMNAEICSTGEQKAMQISLILAQVIALSEFSNTPIILLLDEIFTHFDLNFRKSLVHELKQLNAQIVITTTNPDLIELFDCEKNIVSL